MNKELEIIIDIIKQAWKIVLEYQNKLGTKEIKDQSDLLTQADSESDNFIRTKLSENFPDDKILGDESENNLTNFMWRVWMIDPLDGTKDFVWGGDRYSVMIWLCVDWEPEIWVVFCPSTWDLYYAQKWNWSFFLDGKNQSAPQKIKVSNIDKIEEARYLTKSRFSGRRLENEKIWESFSFREVLDWWSLGIVVGEIARWMADCYILTNKKACKCDSCAPQVILQEAWWKFTDVFWNEINYLDWTEKLSNLFVATNGKLHEKIIEKTKDIF